MEVSSPSRKAMRSTVRMPWLPNCWTLGPRENSRESKAEALLATHHSRCGRIREPVPKLPAVQSQAACSSMIYGTPHYRAFMANRSQRHYGTPPENHARSWVNSHIPGPVYTLDRSNPNQKGRRQIGDKRTQRTSMSTVRSSGGVSLR